MLDRIASLRRFSVNFSVAGMNVDFPWDLMSESETFEMIFIVYILDEGHWLILVGIPTII